MRLALALVALVLSSSLASAQPGMTPPVDPQPTQSTSDKKDPSIAVLLSLGIPLAGVVTMGVSRTEAGAIVGLGALYFGPSTGQWYAGKAGGLGLGLRAVGAVSMVVGFAKVLDSEYDCDDFDNGPCDAERDRARTSGEIGTVMMLGGAGLWVGSSIYDIVLAKRAAESWNREHAVTLTPGLVGTSGSRVPGLYVSGRF